MIKEVQNILNIEASEIEKRNEEVLKHIVSQFYNKINFTILLFFIQSTFIIFEKW